MKYYEFTKRKGRGFFSFITELLGYTILLPLIFFFVYYVLTEWLKVPLPEGTFFYGMLAAFTLGFILFIVNRIMLKGVFVFDDHIEIKCDLLYPRFRNVPLDEITDVRYVDNYRTDADRRYRTAIMPYAFSNNLLAGDPAQPCVKIRFLKHGWYFVGVEDADALYHDVLKRMKCC